jgi:hypothetical protein
LDLCGNLVDSGPVAVAHSRPHHDRSSERITTMVEELEREYSGIRDKVADLRSYL